MPFVEKNVSDLALNPFTAIADDWMLISAGTPASFNTMTASWGGLGHFWNRNVAMVFIRPTRYTYQFVEREAVFSVTFYEEAYRTALDLCGSLSGRDTDKVSEAGLTPVFAEGTVYFAEASTALICRKLMHADLDPRNFDAPDNDARHYPQKDYHRLYVAEIVKALVRV